MKISYNWLKDYLNLTIDPHRLADLLSLSGLEVEEIIEKRLDYPGVVVGQVISVKKHPKADKLSLCEVNTGDKIYPIICGASNVAKGQTVPVALIGTQLPNGLKIKKTKIRGVYSEGMICSEAELGLTDESEGIWILSDNLPLGKSLSEALNFKSDHIFDIAVTPNRPDCLSHIGVAREVAALTNKKLKKPTVAIKEVKESTASQIKIRIDAPQGCPRYSARVIKNIVVKESPRWLVDRLEAVGLRPINNIVDVTNYVLMETGHPLHAFDLDFINGSEIIIRESREGEKFVTLDDQERILKQGTVLICDAKGPVAIGGIMGGLNSEVNYNTKHVLLESAYFNPEKIQISSRYLGLTTEASQRFERGADPNGNIFALNRATQLIQEVAGGKILSGIIDVYPNRIKPFKANLEIKKINNLLGTHYTYSQVKKILESIELKVDKDSVYIPTFRPDLRHSADFAEEIARLHSLDNIEASTSVTIDYNFQLNEQDMFIDRLKDILTGMGLQEIITGSMVNIELWNKLTGKEIYPILNPISKDMDGLRNSLVPSMAQTIQYNLNRQTKNLKLFEINRIFLLPNKLNELPGEDIRLVVGLCGKREYEQWYSTNQYSDFFDVKGILEALNHKISLDNWQFISYSDFTLESDGLGLQCGNKIIGFLGKLSKKIASHLEIDDEVYILEISVTELFKHFRREKKFTPIPRFPSVERDLALIVDDQLESGKILDLIKNKGGKLLSSVQLFDIYKGKQIPDLKKSLAFRLVFQSHEKTLKEDEVNHLLKVILQAAEKTYQAKLRE